MAEEAFYPVDISDAAFHRGPGRLMQAPIATAFPTTTLGVVNPSSSPPYLATSPWTDLGATKGGVSVAFNNSEEAFDIDQMNAEIDSMPTGTELTVSTNLAEMTPERLAFAWEGTDVTTNATPTIPEKNVSFGPFESYTRRRLAVAYRSPRSGKITVNAFRIAQRRPQESTITYNKTGDQQTIPVSFRILPDTSVADVRARYFTRFEQV